MYICSVYLDQQLDNEVSPVDLHAVQEKEKNVEGKIESSFIAHQNTCHCCGVHDLHRKPVQTAEEPEPEYQYSNITSTATIYCISGIEWVRLKNVQFLR